MNSGLFWRALGVQAAAVAVLFAILALVFSHDFFEDAGFIVGPLAWIVCSLVTGRVLSLPTGFVLFAALAGGVAGTIVLVVASHWPGLVAGTLVFAASCAGFEPGAEAPAEGATQR
jgi:hypothetical protein